jgi:hypothetical protein
MAFIDTVMLLALILGVGSFLEEKDWLHQSQTNEQFQYELISRKVCVIIPLAWFCNRLGISLI